VKRLGIDVDGLPGATWGPPPAGKGFSIVAVPDGYRLWMRQRIFAEAIVFGGPWFEGSAPVVFSGFTGGPFWQGEAPSCSSRMHGAVPARWSGFAPANWTDDGIDVELGEGELALTTCAAKAIQFARGRAAAIVPGFLYGLRVSRPTGGDDLYVFMPRASQLAAAGDPEAPLDAADSGPFTRLTFSLSTGSAASASLRLSPASLRLWSTLRTTHGPVPTFEEKTNAEQNLLLDLDVSAVDDKRALASISMSVPPGVDPKPFAPLLAAAKSKLKADR
jgi:hypothetical protein